MRRLWASGRTAQNVRVHESWRHDQGRWLAQNRHALSVWPHISGTTMGIPSAAATTTNVSRSSMTISPPNSGRKLPAYTARRHMPGTPYRRCQTLLGTDMDSFDGVGRDCTARVTEPVRPPARTASFDDVEVPSASATRNSSRRAKTAGAALVLRARKNGGHRQRLFSCPLGVRCLSHDCTIMRGLSLVPVSLRPKS